MRISLIATMMIFFLLLSCSGKEKIVEVPVPVNCTPPAPTGVIALNYDGWIDICWYPSYVNDIDYYEILQADAYMGPYSLVATLNATYPQPYEYCLDFDTPNGEQYFYAVRAVDIGGLTSDYSPDEVTATPRPESPAAYPLTLTEIDAEPLTGGYDFSDLSNTAQDYTLEDTDIYYDVIEEEIFYIATRTGVNIQDYGYVGTDLSSYDFISEAPILGWAPTGKVEAIAGHCYVLEIQEGADKHYAKITIIEVGSDYVKFYWAYQTDPNNRDFSPWPGDDDREPDIRSQELEIKVGRLYPPSLREGSTYEEEHL